MTRKLETTCEALAQMTPAERAASFAAAGFTMAAVSQVGAQAYIRIDTGLSPDADIRVELNQSGAITFEQMDS